MKFKRRTSDKWKEKETTIISTGIRLKGNVIGDDGHKLILNGEFEGMIELQGLLIVGKTGKVQGEIRARNVIVDGDVAGKMTAAEKVEIRDGGKYKGDIVAASIVVSEKALFEGNVKMSAAEKEAVVQKFTEKRETKATSGGTS